MDLNGITWVANIYKKFEAMFLEAEEAMCQETLQYVENQVQLVGASVKKLYSDVMQDLVSPASPDPLVTPDLSRNPCADIGLYKVPRASIKKNSINIDKEVTEDSKVMDGENTCYSSSFSGLHNVHSFRAPSSVGLIKGAGLEMCLEQNEYNECHRYSNVLTKRKSKRNSHLPSETLTSVNPWLNNFRVPAHCRISKNDKEACDQIAAIPHSAAVKFKRSDPDGVEFSENITSATLSITDASIDTSSPDLTSLVELGAKRETGLECVSTTSEPHVSLEEISGTSTTDGEISLLGQNSREPQCSKATNEECLFPRGDSNFDVIENNNVMTGSGFEIIEQMDQFELSATCALVTTEFLDDKPSSDKKRIWRAFSSKRCARKQEYEQLAVQHGHINAGLKQENTEHLMLKFGSDVNSSKSSSPGVCESEWELL